MADEQQRVSTRILEVEEECFVVNFFDDAKVGGNRGGQYLRELFWWHRFQVMSWLLLNGVEIPAHLVSDQNHPRP